MDSAQYQPPQPQPRGLASAMQQHYQQTGNDEQAAPTLPERHQQQHTGLETDDGQAPPLPQRHQDHNYVSDPELPAYGQQQQPPATFVGAASDNKHPEKLGDEYHPPPPPRHQPTAISSKPHSYTRDDPRRVIGYLVPFPKPSLPGIDPASIPSRFLIYTPPPPPLAAPKEGEKEAKLHKVQRKWQEEVRDAKASTAPVKSWQGIKSRATKAIAWGVDQTTTSNLEFLSRIGDGKSSSPESSRSASPDNNDDEDNKTPVSEILLVYPPSMGLSPTEMREEFVSSMLRTKSKAQRDAVIATGLLPVGFGIDILATLIWPFGGLGEIDTVWLYSSVRGARTARSVTKRLEATQQEGELKLNFVSDDAIDILTAYLHAECHAVDSTLFPFAKGTGVNPTESAVLEAIGWRATSVPGEQGQWELERVKEDVRSNMHKGAKEWKKFSKAFLATREKEAREAEKEKKGKK